MDRIEIRSATPGDAEAVADYHDLCFRRAYASQLRSGDLDAPDRDGTRQQLYDWFQPGSGFVTQLAVVDGAPVGHVTVRGHQLVHLFVAPACQGAGLGRRLLELGETLIAADGHNNFELHARVENLLAISFYEAAGWTVTNRLIHTHEHGISYDEHLLVKSRRTP